MNTEMQTEVLVLGSGPGGYSAAFRCADLGLNTIMIEYSKLGGVCLNTGCIPSKTLLHITKNIKETNRLIKDQIIFGNFEINISTIELLKNNIVSQLAENLNKLSVMHKINVIYGYGTFINSNTVKVISTNNDTIIINFQQVIIATGSEPIKLPFIPYADPRVWESTDALKLTKIPEKMLIIGGGIIGLEMATIYQSLGSKIDILEINNQILPLVDVDVIKIFTKNIKNIFNIKLSTKISIVEPKTDGLYVSFTEINKDKLFIERYDIILVSVGRTPNTKLLNLNDIGIQLTNDNFILVNNQMCTNISHIYAIGDVTGLPMLAHKSMYEGRIAAEVISGKKHYFDTNIIPYIAYTDPEIAWVGVTEKEMNQNNNYNYKTAIFPWKASGKALTSDSKNGITKLIFNKDTHKLIGGAVVGINAGELLGEISLAIEMGCDAEDIALTIHAHPTLYESIGLAAEIYVNTITDLLIK